MYYNKKHIKFSELLLQCLDVGKNKIKTIRTPSNYRRYDISSVNRIKNRNSIIVSKKQMERRLELLLVSLLNFIQVVFYSKTI